MHFAGIIVGAVVALVSVPSVVAVPPRTLEDRGTAPINVNLGNLKGKFSDWKIPNVNIPTKFFSKDAKMNVACKTVEELVECQNTCWYTYTPESEFYSDCQTCCRKACKPSSWCEPIPKRKTMKRFEVPPIPRRSPSKN